MKNELTIPFYGLDGNISEEILMGEILPNGHFMIKEIPLFAPNLALDDIVSTETENGKLFFDNIIQESGNTTIHVVSLAKGKFLENLYSDIKKHHGIIRKFGENYLAVSFKSITDYLKFKNILDKYESNGQISYREACLARIG